MSDTKPGTASRRMRTAQEHLLKKPRLLPVAVIIIASCAVYFNALYNDFVIDDIQQVLDNPWIKDVKYIPDILLKGVWEFAGATGNYYRPVMHLIYMLSYHLFGFSPWGYHLVNVLFHAGSSILVFLMALAILKAPDSRGSALLPSCAAAVLFATHPIHTEAVAWVGALPEVSFTFFYLLSLYLYIRSRQDDRPGGPGYVLSVAAYFLATLCKEPAVTLPVILAAYDHICRREPFRPGGALRRYAPYLAVTAIYFALRWYALGGIAPGKRQFDLSVVQYLINIAPLFMQYLEKLVLPFNLNAFYSFRPVSSILETKTLLSFALLPVAAFLAYLSFRRSKKAFFSLLLIVVPLLPALYIQALAGGISFAERYLYLPSVGFILLIALFLRRVWTSKQGTAATAAAFLAVLGVYSVGTIARNAVWKDSYTIWADTVAKSPDSDVAQGNLGYALCAHKGMIDEGIEHLQIALRLNPKHAGTYINLGNAYLSKGMIEQAIESFTLALTLKPGYSRAHYSLGLAYDAKGWSSEALKHYESAIAANPFYADAHNNLGTAYAIRGEMDKAVSHFEAAVRLNPDDPTFRINLSQAYVKLGR